MGRGMGEVCWGVGGGEGRYVGSGEVWGESGRVYGYGVSGKCVGLWIKDVGRGMWEL